ncbi:hypothetical protein Tco_1389335 [Tanacetum coccineum]
MPLISSLPPFMVGGVGGRLVMLVSLGGRLLKLMLIGLSRFRYRRVRMVITIGFVGHGARVPFKLLLPDSDFMLITSFGDSIVMDATHFFVSDLHPRFKEEDLETRFPNDVRVQLARDRLTGKSLRRGQVMKFLKTLILKTLRESGGSVTKPSSIPRVEMV